MKHLSRAVLAALLLSLLSSPSLAVAASCPAPLPQSTLRELDPEEEDLSNYLMLRWLACGPEAVLPLLPLLRDSVRRQVEAEAEEDAAPMGPPDAEGTFVRLIILALSMNPEEFADGYANAKGYIEPGDDDATPVTRALIEHFRYAADPAQVRRHFERGVGAGTAFLRQGALTPAQEQLLELVEIKQIARQGRIAEARDKLALVAAAVPPGIAPNRDDRELLEGLLEGLTEALAPVQLVSPAADTQRWVLDKSTGLPRRRTCGFGAIEAAFGSRHLRAEVLRRADADAAIAELLHEEWHGLVEGHEGSDLLLELLRKRYTAAQLRTGLGDAIASIRSGNGSAGLMLFGQALSLPSAVLEGDASVQGGTKERPLSPQELAGLVRAGYFYRAFDAASAAASSARE